MRRLYATAALAALMGLAARSNGLAQHARPHHTGPDCAACVSGPQVVKVTRTEYGTKEEPFCLSRLSLSRLFSCCRSDCRPDCGPECVTRSKTRLVKYEVTEEKVQMRCAVEKVVPPPNWLRQSVARGAPESPAAMLPPPIAPAGGPLAPLPPR